jgi:putative ABC transport system permease protein
VAPDAEPSTVRAVSSHRPFQISVAGQHGMSGLIGGVSSPFDATLLVSDGAALPPLLDGVVTASRWARVAPTLARGGVVVLTSTPIRQTHVRLVVKGAAAGSPQHLPASFVDVGSSYAPSQAVVSPSVARRFGLRTSTVGLLLTGPELTGTQESTLREELAGLDPSSYLYVERGYQVPGSEKVVLWILFGLGGVLMLGGTLTATFLALSDARPDLATLSAVGASPRTRRSVAAAYAVAVGLVGAVLGAAVGFIPGIAITYPLTRNLTGQAGPSHYLAIPWLLIGALVVALPVLTAGLVGTVARSRLPVVARLD